MFLNDGAFVDAIAGLFASYSRGAASIDTKAEAKHGARSTFRGEGVPMSMDDGNKFGVKSGVKIGRHVQVLVDEGLLVGGASPVDDVGAGRHVIISRGFADSTTIGWGQVKVFVNIVTAEVRR